MSDWWQDWKKSKERQNGSEARQSQTAAPQSNSAGKEEGEKTGDWWQQYKDDKGITAREQREAEARVKQRQEEQQRQAREQERMERKNRAYADAMAQLTANERTDKRSQVMLQGFHRDPVRQAESEAELLARQFERNAPLYDEMGRNASTGGQYADYLNRLAGVNNQYQKVLGKYDKAVEGQLEELKKNDRAAWYAETMSAEQIREAMAQNKQKQQTAREVLHTTPWSDGLGGSANDKALSVDRRIKELEQEGRDYEAALKQREQYEDYAAKKQKAAEIEEAVRSAADFEALSGKRSDSLKRFYGRNIAAEPESLIEWLFWQGGKPDNDWAQMVAKKYHQMTPEQKAVFNYLWAKDDEAGLPENGNRSAAQYMATIPGLQEKYLAQKAEDAYLPKTSDGTLRKLRKVGAYLLDNLEEGTTMALEQGAEALENIFRAEPRFSNYDTNQLLPYAMRQAGDDAGGMIYRTLGEAAQSAGRMLPSMAAGQLVGWLAAANPSAVAALGKATHGVITAERAMKGAQNAVFYLSTKGSAMQEGREKGLSGAALEIYSNLCAISEVGLQNAIGGIAQFGGVSESQLMERVAQIDNVLLRTSARFGVQLGGELLEEELQDWLEPGFVTILTGNEYIAPTALEMLETALSTFFMVGSMNAPDTARYYDSSKVRSNLQTLVAGYRDMGGEYAKTAERIESYIRAMDANPEARFTREDFAAAMDMMGEAEASMKAHDVTPEEIRDALLEETEGEELSEPESGRSDLPEAPEAADGGGEDETGAIYEQTLRQTVENAAGMDEEMLRSVEASVAQNLEAMRDSAPAEEIARAEGELEGLRQVLRKWEQVSRNGERLTQAAGPAALTGKVDEFAADWNGSRETGDAVSAPPLRSAQNDRTGERIATAPAAPRNDNIEGGLNDGEYQQGGRQGAVPTDGQRAERAEQGPADGGQRDAGLGAGGPAGGLGGRAEGSVAGGEGKTELARLRNQIRALEAERRSAAQIGVSFGTKNENLRVVPEELYTSAMREEQARAEENGVRLTFVTGGAIELRGKGGRIITADGLHQVDADGAAHIFARADSRRFSPEQLTRHEDFHNIVANNRGLLLDMVEALYEEQGEEGVARMVDAYVVALDGCYGVYTEGMDEDAQRELAMLYIEEIFADQYAGMNRSSSGARQAVETAGDVAQRFAGDIENARQNRAGIERRNGPGTRLSVDDSDRQFLPDKEYLETVKRGDNETAQRMVDEAAKAAGFTIKAWHGTPIKGITSFDAQKIGSNTDDGLYGMGFYFSTNKVTADQYAKADGETMPVYLKAKNPWWAVAYNDKAKVAEQLGMDENALTYSRSGISSKVVVPAGGQAAQFTSHLAERGYDSIVIQHGNNDYEVVVFDSEQVKSAAPVVRDDNGNVIPLSERFRTDRSGEEAWKNRDIRFSPSEDADDSWGVDWIGKENGPEERGSTSSASRSEAPSPQGEGLETGGRIATAPEAPRNDNEGNGGRSMSAPTEERGRQSAVPTEERGGQGAVPTEESYAEQAREKKVEIAAKTSVEGLKSKLEGAEKRLSVWKMIEKSGMVTEESKRQENQRRIADTQETIDILKTELDRKKAARSAQKADKAARAEDKARRKAEKLEAQKAAELRENRPRQARKEFRQDALNLFSVPAAKRQTLGDLLNRFADKVIHQGSVTEQDRRELFSSLYEAGVETIQGDEYYKQIRDFARGGRIYVPQELRAEIGDDWDAFRKRAWGNGIYLTNDQNDRGADAWNVELAELFPGSFDAQETDSRTILEGIVELAEEGKAEHVSIEEMMLRNQQETGVSVDEQMDELERKVDALIDTFAQKAELEIKLRKAGTMQLVKERQKNREIAARQVQRKKENDTRNQVMKQIQELNRMRKKSAPEIQRQIDEIIGNLDVMARSISPEGLENLQELARKYEEAAEDPNFLGNPHLEQRLARLEKVQLDSLEISDVIELGQTVAALVKSVTEDKRLLTDAREREISDAAEAVNKEILSSEGSKGGKLREFLGNEHLSPTRMIQRLGGWVRGGVMEQLSRALEDGGTRRMDYQRQATRIFDGFVSDKENQAWLRKAQGKDAEWIKVTVPTQYVVGENGRTGMGWTELEITPMMRVGLLMHSKNKDNLRHIKTGGIVIPNKAEYIKGNLAEADARGTRVKLQPETVRAIVKDCTAQERAFAALLEQYYDGFSKDKINEVSMQLDGFERAMTNNYYQIKVSRQFLATQPEQIQKNYALDSIDSIVHERVHAGNPIILEDASTALTGHIDLISKYYGYTAAIRDFNAVMNYTFHQKATTEDGQEYTANAFAGSVKETLGEKWGSGAQKYLDNLLADLQQKSSINETAAAILAKLRGNLAGASLMFNPAVALSQTASLPGAVQVLGVDGVIAGLKPEKVDMELVEKYSPVLWYRNQGNSTQELGDYMAKQGLEGKLPLFFNWIQKMDSWTIRRLWAGAEYRVSKDTDLSPGTQAEIDAGTDAYYQEVARVFQRAVYDTQPNYSEMQRPAILRTDKEIVKFLTMYKTVPLQYYNMMYEAVGRLRADAARAKADPNSKQAQAELGKSKSFAAKTFAGILGANVTYVVMKALVKGLLGGKKDKYLDEEGDLDAGKIFGNLGKDLIDTYAGSIIFGSELVHVIEKQIEGGNYYNRGLFEVSALTALNDTISKWQDVRNALQKEDYHAARGKIKEFAKQIAMNLGVPANNIETYLLGTAKWFAPEWVDRYENFFDEIERADLKGEHGRDLRAAFRVLMDNRTDGLKDETVEELVRLWGNGQTVQVPSAVPASISIDGESHNLSADERSRFREIWGKTVSDNLERLIESESYSQADDVGKAKLIKQLYEYARQQAVEAAVGNEPDAWVLFGKACVAAGVGLEDYLAVAAVGKDKLKGMDGTELDAAIAGRMQFRLGELGGDSLDELGRLFAAGASDVIPSDVPTSITVGGAEIKFSPEERVAWMQAWGRTAGESLEAVMGSKAYQAADDAGKEKLIAAVYDYARAAAGSSVTDSYAPDKWITIGREAESRGIDADEYIIFRQQAKDLKSAEKLDLLKKQSWTEGQKEYIWMASIASEAQLTKYKPLKDSGVKWAAALDLLGVGEASTAGMTQEETARYQAAWDRISGPATKKLMANAAYRTADKATQSAYIDKLNAYTTQTAKAETVRGYNPEKWVELGQKLSKAGVALDEYIVYSASMSDARSRDKYAALNKTGWTESQKLEAMAYISESTHRVATVGMDYQVGLSYYLDALANADADQSGNINQEEAEDYIDRLSLGWEDKAYLWQMVCASSKWKNNPYSAGMGEDIWHSLHPEE